MKANAYPHAIDLPGLIYTSNNKNPDINLKIPVVVK
jgi:hypothetical protein